MKTMTETSSAVVDDESLAEERSGLRMCTLLPRTVVAGKYLIHGELGRGGFAVVYDAEHLGLGRRVAIKVAHLNEDAEPALVQRSRREARISALVRHRNVLEVFDTGQLPDGSPFLVMERIHGSTLAERIAHSRLPLRDVVELGVQLMSALEALADHHIIHRDIKPENLMLHEPGGGEIVVKLVDFGISKQMAPTLKERLTQQGLLVGTPFYMSPEQLRGEELDARTDIYSAGMVLYEALTGKVAHERTNLNDLMLAILRSGIVPVQALRLDCPSELARIVHKALSRSRDRRYAHAGDMRAELELLLETMPAEARDSELAPVEATRPRSLPPVPLFSLGRLVSLDQLMPALRMGWPIGLAAIVTLASGALAPPTTATSAREKPAVAAAALTPVPLVTQLGPTQATLPPQPVVTAPESVQPSSRAAAPHTSHKSRSREQRGLASAKPAAVAPPAGVPLTANMDHTLELALSAYARGRYPQAEQLYRTVLLVTPSSAPAWRGLGLLAAHRGDHVQARAAFERYLALAPHASDAARIRRRLAELPAPSAASARFAASD
jgi:serine/threonine protein kinase